MNCPLDVKRFVRDKTVLAKPWRFYAAVSFFTAALMQLPVGFALDRFGPRRVQIVSLAIAALSATVFGLAHAFWPLFVGRALIGVGVASALVSAIKVAATGPALTRPAAK